MVFSAFLVPVMQLVTLLTLPATAGYALLGLLLSPILVPYLIFKKVVMLMLATPLLLCTLPVSVPVGGVIAAACTTLAIGKALWITFTPLLWPLYFLCKWCKATCIVSTVIVTDTILPFLVPVRFSILAAVIPKAIMS